MANMALRAARQAGQIILRAMDRIDRLEIEQKGRNDFVSNIDKEAESVIIEVLHNAYPEHGILGEEHGKSYSSDEYTWVECTDECRTAPPALARAIAAVTA